MTMSSLPARLAAFAVIGAIAATAHAQAGQEVPVAAYVAPAATIPPTYVPAAESDLALEDYKVGPGDVLLVQVMNTDAFNRKLRVNTVGNIGLPLLGTIHVAGLTPRQIEIVIADVLRERFMNDPQVGVFVEESASLRFSIEGAIKTPNVFPLKGRVTLLQALAMSGGFTRVADATKVRILRITGNEQQTLLFDAEMIREGKQPDPVVLGNDAIIVETSTGKWMFYETMDTIRGFVGFGTL